MPKKEIARVLSGGRIVIPQEYREHLKLKEGDLIQVRIKDDPKLGAAIEIQPVKVVPR